MALPSSGAIDAGEIKTEYTKIVPPGIVDMNAMAGNYSLSTSPNRFSNYYSKSVTQYRGNQYTDPSGNPHLGTQFGLPGSTPFTGPWNWYMYPTFLGYPSGTNVTLGIFWTIDFGYLGSGGTGSVQLRYTTNSAGSQYTGTITTQSAGQPGGGPWSGSQNISIPAANVSNFNFRTQITVFPGDIMAPTTVSIQATNLSIGGVNNIGTIYTPQDTWLIFGGSFEPGGSPYTWYTDVRVN